MFGGHGDLGLYLYVVNTFNSVGTGVWGTWGSWTVCVCGEATHKRSRTCVKTNQQDTDCDGSSQDEKSCDNERFCFGSSLVTKKVAMEECSKLERFLPMPRSDAENAELVEVGRRRYVLVCVRILWIFA